MVFKTVGFLGDLGNVKLMETKGEVIVVKCRGITKIKVEVFKTQYGFNSLEEMLNYLINYHEEETEKRPKKIRGKFKFLYAE